MFLDAFDYQAFARSLRCIFGCWRCGWHETAEGIGGKCIRELQLAWHSVRAHLHMQTEPKE